MLEVSDVEVSGFKAALRGMRNPKDSWEKSDTVFYDFRGSKKIDIGPADLNLAISLHHGGPVHSKFKRMIHVSMDINAPLYWWKEFDTYKVATTANSCSTMHKIQSYHFTRGMFSTEHLNEDSLKVLDQTIELLEKYRLRFLETKAKEDWWQLIQMLPSSFNQKRTVDFNYETISNIFMWRWNHKQDEWKTLCRVFLELPYVKDFVIPEEVKERVLNEYGIE